MYSNQSSTIKQLMMTSILAIALFSCHSDKKSTTTSEVIKDENAVTNEEAPDLNSVFTYYYAEPQTLQEKEENLIIEYIAELDIPVKRTDRGVYYHLSKKGKGNAIHWANEINVHYKGYTLDQKEFDSSYKRGKPITFKVGNMIDGWNFTLMELNKGDQAILFIPSRLGYGEKGLDGLIEPNEVLIFEIEILE